MSLKSTVAGALVAVGPPAVVGGRLEGHRCGDRLIQAMQESMGPLDALVLIIAALFVRTQKHEVRADGVGAILFDELVRDDRVALALGHFGALPDDCAMGTEAAEWLIEVEVAQIMEGHRDEAGVKEMQDGVLVSADVTVDRQPTPHERTVERHIIVIRRRVAQEIPGAVQERVRDVGLSASGCSALGTIDPVPLLDTGQRAHA